MKKERIIATVKQTALKWLYSDLANKREGVRFCLINNTHYLRTKLIQEGFKWTRL